MTERRRRPDLDERFSLYPMAGEDLLAALLGATPSHQADEDEPDLDEQ